MTTAVPAVALNNGDKEKSSTEIDKSKVENDGKKTETVKTDGEEPKRDEAKSQPQYQDQQDSTTNSLNKYNFFLYFIYKHKYESPGESIKRIF